VAQVLLRNRRGRRGGKRMVYINKSSMADWGKARERGKHTLLQGIVVDG